MEARSSYSRTKKRKRSDSHEELKIDNRRYKTMIENQQDTILRFADKITKLKRRQCKNADLNDKMILIEEEIEKLKNSVHLVKEKFVAWEAKEEQDEQEIFELRKELKAANVVIAAKNKVEFDLNTKIRKLQSSTEELQEEKFMLKMNEQYHQDLAAEQEIQIHELKNALQSSRAHNDEYEKRIKELEEKFRTLNLQ